MVVGLAGSALAQTETRRAPANDPSTILGNALFTIHNRLVSPEPEFTVSRSGTGWAVEVPDRPSELYAAPLGARALVLGGRERKTCTITLARASSGVK